MSWDNIDTSKEDLTSPELCVLFSVLFTQEYAKHTEGQTRRENYGGATSQQGFPQQTTHYGDNYNTASKHHCLLWKSIKDKLENLDVSHTGGANGQQHSRPADIEIIIQQESWIFIIRPGGCWLVNNESARNILVLYRLSLYPPGSQQVK